MSSLYLRLAGAMIILITAAVSGLWLGKLSVPDDVPPIDGSHASSNGKHDRKKEVVLDFNLPPLFFYADLKLEGDNTIVYEEIRQAAEAGVLRFVLPAQLPWDEAAEPGQILQAMQKVLEIEPRALFCFALDLNPPKAWLNAEPAEAMATSSSQYTLPSPASERWLTQVQQALKRLTEAVSASPLAAHVTGCILGALDDAQWSIPGGFDRSPVNQRGFQQWLQRRYTDLPALQTAWGDDTLAFATVEIPEKPTTTQLHTAFYDLEQHAAVIDYLAYSSEYVADAIAALVVAIKESVPAEIAVYASYGYSFEHLFNDVGHFALGTLLDSDIDGFVSPVSYIDRGTGGSGGLMGPVHSILEHGKQCLLIDDTRTGVSRDAITGKITRMKGLRAEDVYNVQRRNFSMAAVYGLGMIWADPHGQGSLYESEQWEQIAQMRRIYNQLYTSSMLPGKQPPRTNEEVVQAEPPAPQVSPEEEGLLELGEEDVPEAEVQASWENTPPLPMSSATGLTVVVDEGSRCYQRCDAPLNELLLHNSMDAVLRSGVPIRFYLLQDILDGRGPVSATYLFLNAFHLSDAERQRLHMRLAEEHASAIWIYAPGYVQDDMDAAHVAQTTGMQVNLFEGPAFTGSTYVLSGRWLDQDERYGTMVEIAPLFYVDDVEADVLARYQNSEEPSVAMRYVESGWTSVFLADPNLTAPLLREILQILEHHLYVQPTTKKFCDVTYIAELEALGDTLMMLHGRVVGERAISLGTYCDVIDLFDPGIGWQQKENFVLTLQTGETRLLRFSPLR